jgi:outer membrane protein insertion porin family
LWSLAGSPVAGQETVIEDIVVDGNQALSSEAFLRLTSLRVGDPYDIEAIRADFRRIWDRGLFDDLSVESRDGETGKILIFHVSERPRLNSVEYEKNKAITETQIEEQLSERGVEIHLGAPVDYKVIQDAEEMIRQMVASKGYLDNQVEADLQEVDPGHLALVFRIKPGRKTRLKKLTFRGNERFSDRKLRSRLKLTSQHKWWRFWGRKKTLYHPTRLEQDLLGVEDFYKNNGYLDLRLQNMGVEYREGKPTKKPEKQKRWVTVTVPVREGPQYTLGEIRVEGNRVLSDEEILARIPLKEGDVFNKALVDLGAQLVELDYGERGYFFVSTNRQEERREGNVAELLITVDEDKKYFIDRIEFVGNTTTRDKVLRRELGVNEEELFNLKQFRTGLRKIGQLGYFRLTREPQITPVPGENRVHVRIEGREESRNELQVGGGFSGLDGAFFAGSYSTRNFLGRGQVLSTRIQVGGRSNTYSLTFQEPWFLGRPWSLGASIFRQDTDFIGFRQTGQGGSVSLGRRISNFQSVRLSYLVEEVRFDNAGAENVSTTSSIRPVYSYDTRNNFFRPSRGFQVVASVEFAGGPLGGDNFFYKPILQSTVYVPSFRQSFFGLHGEIGYVDDFDGREVPTFERFFLGGERSLRLFESRTISPRDDGLPASSQGRGGRRSDDPNKCPSDPLGNEVNEECDPLIFIGGNKYLIFNVEYTIPLPSTDTVELVLFYDAGNAWTNKQGYDLSDLRMDAGIEVRFYLPIFGAPLRLIYGWNLDPQEFEDKQDFIFSIGRTF